MSEVKKKNNRGGQRPGAGRPFSANKKVQTSLAISPESLKALADFAAASGRSRSSIAEEAILQYLKNVNTHVQHKT